jgi:prepilin-type N-terminal cleavage/methylation domain-containing protein
MTDKKMPRKIQIVNTCRPAGFTLIETLIALLIMSIVAGVAYGIFASLSKSFTTQDVTAKTQQNLRIGIDFMTRDIRMAGLDPLDTANAGIIDANWDIFRFTADKNMDGDVDDSGEDVTYRLSGKTLQLIDDQGTATLNENITDFEFIYFDNAGAATTVKENIRSVGITLTATTPAGSSAPVERTYNTLIRCRNIGL